MLNSRYFNSRATFVCFAFARPRPIGSTPSHLVPGPPSGRPGSHRFVVDTTIPARDTRTHTGPRGSFDDRSLGHPRRKPPRGDRSAGVRARERGAFRPGASVTSPHTQASIPAWPSSAIATSASSGRRDRDHADAHVERASRSACGDLADLADQAEDRLRRPGRPVHHGADGRRQHAGQVVRQPTSGDVRHGVQSRSRRPAAGRAACRGGWARAAPRPACGRARRRDGRATSRLVRAARDGRGSSRWSAGRRTPSRSTGRPARPGRGPARSVGLDHSGRRAGHVVLVRREQPGVLRCLAADEGAAGGHARLRDALARWPRSARARPCRRRCSRS